MSFSRREFLMGCSAAIAAMAGASLQNLVFANPKLDNADGELFVLIFLRGGMDGLSFLAPYDDQHYRNARGRLALPSPSSGAAGAALRIEPNNPSYASSSFGLHRRAERLASLYTSQKLALIHACGLEDDTRSHFDAMDYIERGTPGNKSTPNGWLARHLLSLGTPTTDDLPILAAGSAVPTALRGATAAVAMSRVSDVKLQSGWRYNNTNGLTMLQSMRQMYSSVGLTPLDIPGYRTLQTVDRMAQLGGNYTPRPGVTYPGGNLADLLKTVAQVGKGGLGLRAATLDFGGWDTHENQGDEGAGYFADRIGQLSDALAAFYDDMLDYHGKLTVVVMSEFGRRLGANASQGTDHGHGNVMMVLGGNVNGGRCYGTWPGLAQLNQGQDLEITTDYRVVLSEVLLKRLANPNLGTIFPTLPAGGYAPLGVVNGAALTPVFQNLLHDSTLEQTPDAPHRTYLPMISKC